MGSSERSSPEEESSEQAASEPEPAEPPASGPADSRLVRTLFYLGDGVTAGAVVYVAVSTVLFAFSGLDGWMVAVLLIFLGLSVLHGWAWLSAMRTHRKRSGTADARLAGEWRATRRWRWVAVVALPVAAALVGATVVRRGWEFRWFLPDSNLVAVGTLAVGLVFRMLARYASESPGEPTFLPGTRRGLAGFLALLVGLLAVLAWGGVPPVVLALVLVGIGGYALLYLLAAAGVE